MGVFIIGVTFTSAFHQEKDVPLRPGESHTLGAYEFRFDGIDNVAGPNYQAQRGLITVLKDGQEQLVLHPEKRVYRVQTKPMTEAGIDAGLFRDLYVALGESLGDDAWSVRLYYKPFIRWIWLGALFMAIGGFIASSDRRYRIAATVPKPAPTNAVGGTLLPEGHTG